MENIPFPPVSLLHSSFPFLPPWCFMYMNRWRTSAGEFPKVQWEVLLIALHARLLWLKPMMWGCYLYLRRGEDRSDGFLPVKQGGISDMTHKRKSVFYIQVIPDNEMQKKKPLQLVFTSLKWSSFAKQSHSLDAWYYDAQTICHNNQYSDRMWNQKQGAKQFSGPPFQSKALNECGTHVRELWIKRQSSCWGFCEDKGG